MFFFFFFSSRRRHTRLQGDWSSDVCSSDLTTKQHGTGLGLAIVQSVVSDHGAKVAVESKPGVGTTFRLDFPLRAPSRDGGRPVKATTEAPREKFGGTLGITPLKNKVR